MSSGLGRIERFLAQAGVDRAPWLAVAFGCGIAAWFVLPQVWQWLVLVAAGPAAAGLALVGLRRDGAYPHIRLALAGVALTLSAGGAAVWSKSVLVGAAAIPRPVAGPLTGLVLSRDDRPAADEVRILLATRDPLLPGRIIRARIRVPTAAVVPGLTPGARIALQARLMPPAPPLLPGSHDYARAAWFDGVAATGAALGPVTVLVPGDGGGWLTALRSGLSDHIAGRLGGSQGGIAAALASGDRGSIARGDEDALRDAGLSHLLSVSGLHVSAVIAAAYWLALRLLALSPWLALRVRVPLWAAAAGALAGVLYTLLTGAEVPTVRSMVGALLVLAAVALGREPLSLRLLAVAAFAVMLLWPEAVAGPSFQLSFGAVLAIVAVHNTRWMRALSARRDEAWWLRLGRHALVLVLTGVAIELALMPIGLFHFHRAGVLGALANVVAIPLTTFVIMPLVALALLLDLAGLGLPVWWLADQSLSLLLVLAHLVARQPGAVALLPAMGGLAFALFLGGGLWLALWPQRVRRWGLLPLALGSLWLAMLRPPDLLVSADGRHIAVAGELADRLLVLRDSRSGYARDALNEMAAVDGDPVALADWPGARCNADFCAVRLHRGGRDWQVLIARSRDSAPLRGLAAACERSDIVIADRRLPAACRPRALRIDRAYLARTGGVAIDLAGDPAGPSVRSVRTGPDDHGWRQGT